MSNSTLVTVFVQTRSVENSSMETRSYRGEYLPFTCIGELVRNLCVNLFIDPDTENGIKKNIKLF